MAPSLTLDRLIKRRPGFRHAGSHTENSPPRQQLEPNPYQRLTRITSNPAWVGFSLLLLVLSLRILSLQPIESDHGDPMGYWLAARQLIEGHGYDIDNHRLARYALILPVSAIQWIFGSHPIAYYLWPLTGSVLSCLTIWQIGRQTGHERAGIYGAILLACAPIFAHESSQIFPDAWMGTYILLATLASAIALTSPHPKTFALVSGLFFILAWGTKITAIYFLPVFLLLYATHFRSRPAVPLVFFSTVAAGYLAEHMIYWWALDYPLGPLSLVKESYGLSGRLQPMPWHELVFGRFLNTPFFWSILLWGALISAPFLLWKRAFPVFLILLPISFLVCLNFHVKSFSPLIPGTLFDPRYMLAAAPFMFLIIGKGLDLCCHRRPRLVKTMLGSAIVLAFSSALYGALKDQSSHPILTTMHNQELINQAFSNEIPALFPEGNRIKMARWTRRIYLRECCDTFHGPPDHLPQSGFATIGYRRWPILAPTNLYETLAEADTCHYVLIDSEARAKLVTDWECPSELTQMPEVTSFGREVEEARRRRHERTAEDD